MNKLNNKGTIITIIIVFVIIVWGIIWLQQKNGATNNKEMSVNKEMSGNKEMSTVKGFNCPTGITEDSNGNLYVTNWGGGTISKVQPDGGVTEFSTGYQAPAGIVYADNQLYASDYSGDTLYRISLDGEKSVLADGFHTPTGISLARDGSGIYVTNRGSDEIVKVDFDGNKEIVADGMSTPVGVVEDENGNLFVTNYGGSIIKVDNKGKSEEYSTDFVRPGVGITFSNTGDLLAVDNGDGNVKKIDENGKTEVVSGQIGGCVALFQGQDDLYAGGWSDGVVQKINP